MSGNRIILTSTLLPTRPHCGFVGCVLETNIFFYLNKLLRTIDFTNLSFPGKRCSVWKIEVYHLMLNDKPNVMTELALKGLRFVEIIEIMD